MTAELSRREMRCLRRIEAKQSLPDFGALAILDSKGLVSMSGEGSDNLSVTITPAGYAAIAKANATTEAIASP